MSIWLDILCLILLILLNGFFAMSEISIVTARRSKLQMLADQGASGAELALSLSENPDKSAFYHPGRHYFYRHSFRHRR